MPTLASLKTAQAQYWPSETDWEPGDLHCLHEEDINHNGRNSYQYYRGSSGGDGFFYEVRCVGGSWTGPVCFETGIIMTRDRPGYRYYSGRNGDGSYYCHACGGRSIIR